MQATKRIIKTEREGREMTTIIGIIAAIAIITVVDITVQKIMFNTIEKPIIIMIIEEIKTIIENRE